MSNKRGRPFKTRDPRVTVRDPVIEQPEKKAPRMEYIGPVPSVFVPITVCPHKPCTGTVWRNGGSSMPNPSTKEMWHWRVCTSCEKSHWQRKPMNARQLEKYLPPD
jgi:hypothetical protein